MELTLISWRAREDGGSDLFHQAEILPAWDGDRDARLATMNPVQDDDCVVARASCTQTVTAADGRTLAIAECGDPDGFPVFWLHGTPGSRFAGQGFASVYADAGARVVTYDRPGYGGSDACRPGEYRATRGDATGAR